jgi:type IV secretory pathway VirB2 component (pilin)
MKKKFFNHCFFVIFSLFMALPTLIAIGNDVMAQTPPTCTGTTSATCYSTPGCAWNGTSCAVASLVINDADAKVSNQNAFVATICNALRIITGNGGKAFAAFAIISLGIGFFTGKVSWGLMIGIAAGIAAMFGAPTIVAAISGTDKFDCNYQKNI